MSDRAADSTGHKLSTRRLWAFRLICVALAVLPFIVAEIWLRATRHINPADLTTDPIFDTGNQPSLFVESVSKGRWEIPDSRLNFFRPASFVVEKPANLRRIFVLGGSTVAGRPYETETAFAKWLELRLTASDPEHQYEVINCGGVSYASYRIAIILDEVLDHQADAIVLYTGHNEFLEERSYSTIPGQLSFLQRITDRSALVQSIGRSLKAESDSRQILAPELRTRLDIVDGMSRYVRDDIWRESVVNHFRITLARMIQACENANVPLLLCVPTSDCVRTPPLKIMPIEMETLLKTQFDAQWQIARSSDHTDQERLQACQACLALDPKHAGAHYIAGSIHWSNGRSRQAQFHLIAARDADVCPLRATTPIVDTVQQLAERYNVPAVDCNQILDRTDSQLRALPDGIPDPQRFVDHIHPAISAHQDIAGEVAEQVYDLFAISPVDSAQADYESAVIDHLATLDETYYARGAQRLEGLLNWAAGRAGKLATPSN